MQKQQNNLHHETVSPLLMNCLNKIMAEGLFDSFRLVGGTNLSLRFGHRISDDIDLFTDAEYGSVDYPALERWLSANFPFFDNPYKEGPVGFGKMYYIGLSTDNAVKLDVMYTDKFFSEPQLIEGIRMASTEQMVAMKMEAINFGGRKKDWWDIHMLLEHFSMEEMFELHKQWQPYTHDRERLFSQLINFTEAEGQPDPRCLLQKDWDLIKMDIYDEVERLSK